MYNRENLIQLQAQALWLPPIFLFIWLYGYSYHQLSILVGYAVTVRSSRASKMDRHFVFASFPFNIMLLRLHNTPNALTHTVEL